MRLHIRNENDETFVIEVDSTLSVRQLKGHLSTIPQINLKPEQQQIIFEDTILHNDSRLNMYNFSGHRYVHVLHRNKISFKEFEDVESHPDLRAELSLIEIGLQQQQRQQQRQLKQHLKHQQQKQQQQQQQKQQQQDQKEQQKQQQKQQLPNNKILMPQKKTFDGSPALASTLPPEIAGPIEVIETPMTVFPNQATTNAAATAQTTIYTKDCDLNAQLARHFEFDVREDESIVDKNPEAAKVEASEYMEQAKTPITGKDLKRALKNVFDTRDKKATKPDKEEKVSKEVVELEKEIKKITGVSPRNDVSMGLGYRLWCKAHTMPSKKSENSKDIAVIPLQIVDASDSHVVGNTGVDATIIGNEKKEKKPLNPRGDKEFTETIGDDETVSTKSGDKKQHHHRRKLPIIVANRKYRTEKSSFGSSSSTTGIIAISKQKSFTKPNALVILRRDVRFIQICRTIQQRPDLLHLIIEKVRKNRPHLFTIIRHYQNDFLKMLGNFDDQRFVYITQQGNAKSMDLDNVSLTKVEEVSVEFLAAMGFSHTLAKKTFLEAGRNEQLAAKQLYRRMEVMYKVCYCYTEKANGVLKKSPA